jgi:nucleotide-binding universal stress UspA family protein
MESLIVIKSSETPRDAAVGTRRSHQWGPILVGTDGSDGAARAVDAAGGLAADLDTDLWVVYVIDGTSEAALTLFARADESAIGDAVEATARRILTEAASRAKAGGARRVHTELRWGSCAEELVAAARKVGATVIVVGRRGAGGRLAQALIGSVSQKLAGISPTYLAIVP